MGGRVGGRVGNLAVRNEAVGNIKQIRSSGIKDTNSATFTSTNVLSSTMFGTNVRKLVTRFETCGTVAMKSFNFTTTAASRLDTGDDPPTESPSKRIKLSRILQVDKPSTPPPRSSGKRHPRTPKPWWGHKGSSSSSPSTRPRVGSSQIAGMPAPQPRAQSESMALVSRWGSRQPRQSTRPPSTQSMPAGSGSSPDDNFWQSIAALHTAESGHARQRPLLHHHHPDSQEHSDLVSSTSLTLPEEDQSLILTAKYQGSQASKNASLCISSRGLTVDQTPVKTYLQRPESPAKKGINLHKTSSAHPTEDSLFSTHQNHSTLTWKGIKGKGVDRSSNSSSTLQPVGLVRCSLAGTALHLRGRKTTCVVEIREEGPMRCGDIFRNITDYDDITKMYQPEIPGETTSANQPLDNKLELNVTEEVQT